MNLFVHIFADFGASGTLTLFVLSASMVLFSSCFALVSNLVSAASCSGAIWD
jgi:hypothetical protein